MSKIGVLREEKEEGVPLSESTKSTSSHSKDLDNDTVGVGGVKPVFPGGLVKDRAENRLLPGVPVVLGREVRCGRPDEVIENEDLLIREAFETLRMTGHN